MDFIDRFDTLCAEKGRSPTAVGEELGFARSAVSRWRKGTAKPNFGSLTLVADYFNVSTDYLLGKTDIKNPPNQQEPEEIAKVALFGGDSEVTEEMWQEVKDYVEYVKTKHFKE